MRNFAIGLLSAAALATTLLLVRQQREGEVIGKDPRILTPGETRPNAISLERMREAGL